MNQPMPRSEEKTVNVTTGSLAANRFLVFLDPELPLTKEQQVVLKKLENVSDEKVNQPGFRNLPVLTLPEELFPGGYTQPQPEGRRRQNLPSSLVLRCVAAAVIFFIGFMTAELRPLLSTPQTITPRSPTLMAINVTPLELVEVPGAAVSCPVATTVATKAPLASKKKRFLAKRSKKKALAKNNEPFPFLSPDLDGLVGTSSAKNDLFPLED